MVQCMIVIKKLPFFPSFSVYQNFPQPKVSDTIFNSEKIQQNIADGNFEFLKNLSTNELLAQMNNLDAAMEHEIDSLRQRYNIKRQPILDAKDQKRKNQQNF